MAMALSLHAFGNRLRIAAAIAPAFGTKRIGIEPAEAGVLSP